MSHVCTRCHGRGVVHVKGQPGSVTEPCKACGGSGSGAPALSVAPRMRDGSGIGRRARHSRAIVVCYGFAGRPGENLK